MLAALSSGDFRAGFYLTGPEPTVVPLWRQLALVPDPDLPDQSVLGPYVPVNPLAAKHRHHGFGFTEYVLILSGPEGGDPPTAADSIGAALPDTDVVVVGDAVASAWKGRTLRGRVGIDTRTDLWRLMAHAAVCIDLAPGRAHRSRVRRGAPFRYAGARTRRVRSRNRPRQCVHWPHLR